MPKRTAVSQVLGGLSESRKEDTAALVNTCVKCDHWYRENSSTKEGRDSSQGQLKRSGC